MRIYKDHLILSGSKVKEALFALNELSQDAILFVVDSNDKLIGALTDGDVRRGLLKGFTIDSLINEIIQDNPRYITKGENNLNKIIEYREGDFRIVPIVDENHRVVNVINFRNIKSYLPIDTVIMAGGRGQRLQPLTDTIPKPLLKVGDKAIIEHNLDRLALFGIDDFWISVKYLGEQIQNHFGDGKEKNVKIEYVWENEPLGTIGAVSQIKNFDHDYILVTNSDLLTNIDYEQFFLEFIKQDADLAVLTIPYQVSIPYAVLETNDGFVKSFKEKPTYTYYSNGGIYLIKKEMLKHIPADTFFNATDFMEQLIKDERKVISFPFSGYWLDVGKHEDFEKAQIDIKNIKM
ncbi:nucleotidyltransferase family protein [Flavobacterium sp. MC2016-06]|jgi:dTDP-glucose pyrophosphorylase/mRNA-degrading endonuclease RelE of RelBE toxin-antitoxin system|uniref:nucleotidyltransferase family protein n=1 Tax=Flavobacterium sp. MC2016-06 TaxID=2676308 RepID=UPI0012BB12F6|nr:nucleotidyltransferase family protein [Flavobacterium sp. MC2016-06]MBU3858633.1 nucleotidyltransferase family protein [Flavobacterium sp. MC2016-06]